MKRSILRRLISRACGLYPNVFFYGSKVEGKLNDVFSLERNLLQMVKK